jgi:hypothetical protein
MNHCSNRLDLLTSGVWINPYEATADVLRAVDMWIEEAALERIYICPLCGYIVYRPRGVILWPRCPRHREMVWYVPKLVKDSKLYDWLKEDVLAKKLMVLEVLAKMYAGRPPDEWRLYVPPAVELAFNGDPSVFRYAWWRNTVEVYIHRLGDEQFLTHLKRSVDYLGLKLCVEIKHAAAAPPDAVYDEERGVYRIVVA